MFCPSCGVAVDPTQRFCNACGTALLAPPMSPGASFPPPAERRDDGARPAGTIAVPPGEIPPIDSPEFDEMFDTKRFVVVEQSTPTQEQGVTTEITDAVPRITTESVIVYATTDVPSTPLRAAVLVLALATATVTVLAAVMTVVRYRVTGDV